MTGIEWILGICASLGAAFLLALVGIGWKSRETLVRMETEFVGFKSAVKKDFDDLSDKISQMIPYEARLRKLEDHSLGIDAANEEHRRWRPKVEEQLQDHSRRINKLEDAAV